MKAISPHFLRKAGTSGTILRPLTSLSCALYPDLHRMAQAITGEKIIPSLCSISTSMVHEAYERLRSAARIEAFDCRAVSWHMPSQVMRSIIVATLSANAAQNAAAAVSRSRHLVDRSAGRRRRQRRGHTGARERRAWGIGKRRPTLETSRRDALFLAALPSRKNRAKRLASKSAPCASDWGAGRRSFVKAASRHPAIALRCRRVSGLRWRGSLTSPVLTQAQCGGTWK